MLSPRAPVGVDCASLFLLGILLRKHLKGQDWVSGSVLSRAVYTAALCRHWSSATMGKWMQYLPEVPVEVTTIF